MLQDGQHREPTSNRNLELGSQTILSVQHGTASVPLGPKIVSRIRSHNNHFARVLGEKLCQLLVSELAKSGRLTVC